MKQGKSGLKSLRTEPFTSVTGEIETARVEWLDKLAADAGVRRIEIIRRLLKAAHESSISHLVVAEQGRCCGKDGYWCDEHRPLETTENE